MGEQEEPKFTVETEIDVSLLTIGDIIFMDDVRRGEPYDIAEAARMLDRLVVGGVRNRPIAQYRPLLIKILTVIKELANPKSEG